MVKEAMAAGVVFESADMAAVQNGTATYHTLASVADRIRLSYYKAQLVCNAVNGGVPPKERAIPEGCRGAAFDGFVPNDRTAPFKTMLRFQKKHFPEEYALGVWPLPRNQLDLFYYQESLDGLPPGPNPDTIENGAAMGEDV